METEEILKEYTEDAEMEKETINAQSIPENSPPIFDTEKEPEKRKRGRPKGSTKKSENRFTETVEGTEIINGMLFIFFIDTAIPMTIALINNRYNKNKKINANDLKLSARQKTELEPIANEVAKQIAISGNPITILSISLIGIYAGNYMTKIYS
jgi:hypothetical protein